MNTNNLEHVTSHKIEITISISQGCHDAIFRSKNLKTSAGLRIPVGHFGVAAAVSGIAMLPDAIVHDALSSGGHVTARVEWPVAGCIFRFFSRSVGQQAHITFFGSPVQPKAPLKCWMTSSAVVVLFTSKKSFSLGKDVGLGQHCDVMHPGVAGVGDNLHLAPKGPP